MKSWHVVVLSVVVGVGLGIGATVLRLASATWDGTAEGAREGRTIAAPPQEMQAGARSPKVSVDKPEYDYGVMDSQSEGHHDFKLTNVGEAALTLEKGDKSCQCTEFSIEKARLKPGESTKVTMKWLAKSVEGALRNRVTVKTNDPDRPRVELTVTGKVTVAISTLPEEVDFTRVEAGKPATMAVRVVGHLPQGFRVEKHAFVEPKYAEYFDVKIQPMTEAQVKAEKDAKSGYVADVIVKAGLPVGTFRQILRLTTNLKTTPTVSIPVRGSVVSDDIVMIGRGLSGTLLDVDVVSPEKETARKLTLIARGPHYKKMSFQVLDVYPDVLKVEIGKTVELSGEPGTQTPLTIRIPKDSRSVNCLGFEHSPMGRILLNTNHPSKEAKEVLIRVRFAVEG
jgi:hypothetical protein